VKVGTLERGKMYILLADNQQRVRSAIRLLLEQQSEVHEVQEATNAQELLRYVKHNCPDVLLLDWGLPGLASRALIKKLHTICSNLFTIVMDSRPQNRQLALEAGANEFISKNDPPEGLLAAIKNIEDFLKKNKD